MADWHLKELRDALEQRSWQIDENVDEEYSLIWGLKRSVADEPVYIEFNSFNEFTVLPIEQAHGCKIKDHVIGLYFRRKGYKNAAARKIWIEELREFINKVDSFAASMKKASSEINPDEAEN